MSSTSVRQSDSERSAPSRRWLGTALNEFPWLHMGLGILGNTAFLVGSVFFLYESLKTAGIWLFVVGSAGMLIGALGQLLVTIERKRLGEN